MADVTTTSAAPTSPVVKVTKVPDVVSTTPIVTPESSKSTPETIVPNAPNLPVEDDVTISKRKDNEDNREVMISGDIALFEAYFEVMEKNEREEVNVEKLVDKLSTSGLFTFDSNPTNLARKTEEKLVKEELLDLIEDDLSLTVMGWISIDKFFKVVVRFPRYLHRLKRAAGDVSSPPRVWEKPEPLAFEEDDDKCLDDGINDCNNGGVLDVNAVASDKKQIQRQSWRNHFKDMFARSHPDKKKKKNPKN